MTDSLIPPHIRDFLFEAEKAVRKEDARAAAQEREKAATAEAQAQAEAARAAALKRRPPPPDGFMHFDQAAALLSERKQHDAEAAAATRDQLGAAIVGGGLAAVSARTGLKLFTGVVIDFDDCLVNLAELGSLARVDLLREPGDPAASQASAVNLSAEHSVHSSKTGQHFAEARVNAVARPLKNRLKSRADVLTTPIEQAFAEVGDPWRPADIWSLLTDWAKSEPPRKPFLGAKTGVITYADAGSTRELTKRKLGDRVRRLKESKGLA